MERFPAGNEEMYGCTEKTICLKIHAVPLQKSVYLYVIYWFFFCLFFCTQYEDPMSYIEVTNEELFSKTL